MIDFRPIFFVIGILLTTLAVVMGLPALADFVTGNVDDAFVFAVSAGITLFAGGGLILTNRIGRFEIHIQQAFILTTLSWLVIAVFAALPLAFAELNLSFTDAFFEAMSGITTTGATVIVGLDDAPPGILLWRALLQWLGGIGIIVVAIAVLPMLAVGGMQLFRVEFYDPTEKALPRAAQIAAGIGVIYLALTAISATALWLAGMTGFESVIHAMTTISTGGFSTSDASVGYFDSAAIEVIITIFMILGGMPFVLFLESLRGNPGRLFRNTQVHWYLGILASGVLALTLWQWLDGGESLPRALRSAVFNVVSMQTGTGFATTSFDQWGGFAMAVFLFLMVVGGCAGSTSCGIKVFRFQVIYATAKAQMARLIQPHGVFVAYYNRRPITEQVASSVMGFFFLFALSFAVLALGLGLAGLDFLTSMSGAAAAIANVGPGLGPVIGPEGNFSSLPDAAKWLLSFGMLIGRLELYTVLVLFAPSFWRG